jgi:hypothetical protein
MCGASDSQKNLEAEQADFYKQAMEMTRQQYEHQQAIWGPMAKQFQSIFDKGPNTEGFSEAQKADLTSQVVTGTAQNYKQASEAISESLAAEGGPAGSGNGAQDQIRASIASSAAAQKSKQELGIEEASYEQGYQEWLQAGQGLTSIAAGENPVGFENAATESGSAASKTANDIATQDNSWINAAIGAAGAIGSGWATGGFKTHA